MVAATGGCALLTAAGIVGEPPHPERFDAKLVIVQPSGDGGLRIREIVDEDFGDQDRHGYQRIIPNDFGAPSDVQATSPDGPAPVSVVEIDSETRIRLGDPSTTVSGQHRYDLSYTLHQARLSTGELALDIIGTEETLATGRFEVIVTGMDLTAPTCNVGALGTTGGCELTRDGDLYRAVIGPLKPGEGMTIGGTITRRIAVADVPIPAIPTRRANHRVPLALGTIPLGLGGGGAVYAWARRRGRNEVYAGGATDAAHGAPPPGPTGATPMTTLVTDDKMADLATTEFVPPKGIEPWQANVLLTEHISNETVNAWLSGMVAKEGINLERTSDGVVLSRGAHPERLAPTEAQRLDEILAGRSELTLGQYDPAFTGAWANVSADIKSSIAKSGWWSRMNPASASGGGGGGIGLIVIIGAFFVFGAGSLVTAALGAVKGPVLGLAFGLLVPAVCAWFVYRAMLPARTAAGSAYTLQAESFRRFLQASEGPHVEWAWKHDLLREYSAWAVALGAAEAWSRALASSNVPQSAVAAAGPLIVPSIGPSIQSTHTRPAPTGGGLGGSSGGGFSGGSVGGGGGGGSSGSW